MRAACTAATWRASNSDWVTMSPFTRTITRSSSSAPANGCSATRRLRLSRTGLGGFMVHLRAGEQARDEFALGALLLLLEEQGADAMAALLEIGGTRFGAGVDAQHVVPEGRRHHVARFAGGERESRRLQLGR